jgi:hypothetical protein
VVLALQCGVSVVGLLYLSVELLQLLLFTAQILLHILYFLDYFGVVLFGDFHNFLELDRVLWVFGRPLEIWLFGIF